MPPTMNRTQPAPPKKELVPLPQQLPVVPVPPADFLQYVKDSSQPMRELMKPYLEYERIIRAYLAQDPEHPHVADNTVGLMSLFDENGRIKDGLEIRARDLSMESKEEKKKFIMPLTPEARKSTGEMMLVPKMSTFKENFHVFSEGALQNLDWSNVVVSGSAVLSALLLVPEKYQKTKRNLRKWYHEELAPASDIDLFLYGFENEEDAIAKMEEIEKTVEGNLLPDTVTIRTRNTLTIASKYPNRHIQIVLRLYKSISQILHGFDVDCSCICYDGSRILANPRAVASCITQCNMMDLSRRSPSYESRLAKYSKRGFEVYCPFLDRTRIDPTIFERSYARTVGLARLLVLEAFRTIQEREEFQRQRRKELGRPEGTCKEIDSNDQKELHPEDVGEWDVEEEVSDYLRFMIPYGEKWTAARIERYFYKWDMNLNGEWMKKNKPPYRDVKLHRHPVFIGSVRDVVEDCCGKCPQPLNDDDAKVAETENKIYVNGKLKLLTYLEDDPGRQEVGSFRPLGPDDYTEMAYVSDNEKLCQAIVNNDVDSVRAWCATLLEDNPNAINRRDICGRTPLHLACMNDGTTLEVAQVLIDNGARLIARMQDGSTALHFAAVKGDAELVGALLQKSAANEEEKKLKERQSQDVKRVAFVDDGDQSDAENNGDSDFESVHMSHSATSTRGVAPSETTQGFVKVGSGEKQEAAKVGSGEEEEGVLPESALDGDEGDDIIDINLSDWDHGMTALHHALLEGHHHVVELLVSEFGADVRQPIKTVAKHSWDAAGPILNLVATEHIHGDREDTMLHTLIKLGSSVSQLSKQYRVTVFHIFALYLWPEQLERIFEWDGPKARSVLNHAGAKDPTFAYQCNSSWRCNQACYTPLSSCLQANSSDAKIELLLKNGASPNIKTADTLKYLTAAERNTLSKMYVDRLMIKHVTQPLEYAILGCRNISIIGQLLEAGADPNIPMSRNIREDCRELRDEKHYWRAELKVGFDKWPPKDGLSTPLDHVQRLLRRTRADYKKDVYPNNEPWKVPYLTEIPEKLKPLQNIDFAKFEKAGGFTMYVAQKAFDKLHRSINGHNINELVDKDLSETISERVRLWKEALRNDERYLVDIEAALLKHGAKTYEELHPKAPVDASNEPPVPTKDVEDDVKYIRSSKFQSRYLSFGGTKTTMDKVFEPKFEFHGPHIDETESLRNGYVRLFNAVWDGDYDTVKLLTSGPSGEGQNKTPKLLVTVSEGCSKDEDNRISLLAIAVALRRYEMLELLLDIAHQQFGAPDSSSDKDSTDEGSEDGNYRIDDGSEDDNHSLDLALNRKLRVGGTRDESQFVVKDVNDVEVINDADLKSNISAFEALKDCKFCVEQFRFVVTKEEDEAMKTYCGKNYLDGNWIANPITWAVIKNDLVLLRKSFELIGNLACRGTEKLQRLPAFLIARLPDDLAPGSSTRSWEVSTVRPAIEMGRIDILEELMRHAWFTVCYEDLDAEEREESHDIERADKAPEVYQGLIVRGMQRGEWARSTTPRLSSRSTPKYLKPYHIALRAANKDSMEWMKSERPWICLQDFMQKYEGSREVRALRRQGEETLKRRLPTWLGTDTKMEAHLMIHGWNPRSEELLRESVNANRALLTVTDDNLRTPALYAVSIGQIHAGEVLASLGADFTVRNSAGENVLHLMLNYGCSPGTVRRWQSIIPPRVLQDAALERTKRTLNTPVMQYLIDHDKIIKPNLEVVRWLLGLSDGKDLELSNAEGNFPMHIVCQNAMVEIIELYGKVRPDLLHRENSNGRTPGQIARATWLYYVSDRKQELKVWPESTWFDIRRTYAVDEDVYSWQFTPAREHKQDSNDKKITEEISPDPCEIWCQVRKMIAGISKETRTSWQQLPKPISPKFNRRLVTLAEINSVPRRPKNSGSDSDLINDITSEEQCDREVLELWGSAGF